MSRNLKLQLLQSHYRVVLSLRDYLSQICDPYLTLEKSNDPDRYRTLLRTTYIALPEALDASSEVTFEAGQVMSEMYEVIDRVQVRLFEQTKGKPLNILTMGYRRAEHRGEHGRADMSRQAVTNFFPNTNITALQALEWKLLLTRIGEAAMYHLLLNTNIFLALPNDSFCQLVGTPISETKAHTLGFLSAEAPALDHSPKLQTPKRPLEEDEKPSKRRRVEDATSIVSTAETAAKMTAPNVKSSGTKRSPADIPVSRFRTFYARPIEINDPTTGRRTIVIGLPPNNVLQRLAPVKLLANGDVPSKENIAARDARHVLKYIFPRQFGLRHPFDSTHDRSGWGYKFEDYTNRAHEIQMKGPVKTPKRLKPVLILVHQLIKKHWACNYKGIFSTTCPSKLKIAKHIMHQPLDSNIILELMAECSESHDVTLTQAPTVNLSADSSHPSLIAKHGASMAAKAVRAKPRFAEFMCSHGEACRYVVEVTKAVIPKEFWGCQKNFKTIMTRVKQLIKGRRFESINLHLVLQGFSTQECDWLLPENRAARHQRPSVTDAIKRRELVEEFLYWYFDSFVIPLLRTSFYATESSAFRQRVLYFRQDDWATLCRPLIARLTRGNFQKLDAEEAQNMLRQHKLGFSFVRLLPKDTGVRPIVNLKRKSSQGQDGSPTLSINNVLQAAFQILTYEKGNQSELLGASVFAPNQIYEKLKCLKARLLYKHGSLPKLYFVKVDVRTCFDSIKQNKLVEILQRILSEDGYMIQRYACLVPFAGKVRRKFWGRAWPEADHPHFLAYAAELAKMLRRAIFVDKVVYSYEDREDILHLLKEHVTENVVKIGNYYYRQTVGIPQGSVLSTILCSFFYGDLETKVFKFTEDAESMLCRLVDDYLFVTADKARANKFLDMMTTGHPEYGCFISLDKTLINFDANNHEHVMNQIFPGQKHFPWCGLLIDMNDLSISTDYTGYKGCYLSDTLTIERRRSTGLAFAHKMMWMAKLRSHPILWDASLNSVPVAHRNVYQSFLLAGMKMYCYVRGWGVDVRKKSVQQFILNVIHKTIRFTYRVMRLRSAGRAGQGICDGAVFKLTEESIIWLGIHAFWTVLKRKRSKVFTSVTTALESDLQVPKFAKCRVRFAGLVKESSDMIEGVSY